MATFTGKLPVPPGWDYATGSMAMAWYGITFRYHVLMHVTDGVEYVVHVLPTYIMFLLSLATLLEWRCPHVFMATVTRIYCMFFLGTWFIHCSFVLYIPTPFPGDSA